MNQKSVLKGSFSLFLFAAILFAAFQVFVGPFSANAAAVGAMPFGGKISSIKACNNGVLATLSGRPYAGPLMWTPGTKGYLFNNSAPPKAGQNVLGIASGFVACTVGSFVVGGGPRIVFYGSSK